MDTFNHTLVIDPGTRTAETDSFNHISRWSPLPCTYHLPALHGLSSLNYEEFGSIKAIIILGGSGDFYEDIDWIQGLEKWFRQSLEYKIPTLGICWGHQWIAHLFGGEVGKALDSQEKMRGFREVFIKEHGPYKASSGSLVISHRDMVTKAPTNADCFVNSELLANEGFTYHDYPIYTFQAHAEGTPGFLENNSIPNNGDEDLSYGNQLVKTFLDWSATY